MIFVDLFAWIIFIFLTWYVLLQFYIISCSSRGRIVDIEKRSYSNKFDQNITVIVYSHNNLETVIELVEGLKKQNYDSDKFSVNVILDNCDDESAKLLEIIGGTRLWRITTDVKPIGKYKAIAWLLERILSVENTNAFVFLTADVLVKQDFLSKLNSAIQDNPVLIGDILPVDDNYNFFTKLHLLKSKIKNKINVHGRHYASLANLLDSNIFAIRQDILEKINFQLCDNGFEEFEYSVKLSNTNIEITYSSEFAVYKQFFESLSSLAISQYKKRYKSFITFKNNFMLLFSGTNLKTKELLLSLLYPSGTLFTMLVIGLFWVSPQIKYTGLCFIHIKFLIFLLFGYFIASFASAIGAKAGFENIKTSIQGMFLAPVIFVCSFFLKLVLNFNLKFKEKNKAQINKDNEKVVIDVTITDGRGDIPCKLEIKQGEENQAIFIFKNKKMASAKHPRIDDAIEELIEKLKLHGFALKICLNCGYFEINNNVIAKFDGKQGYCLFKNLDTGTKEKHYSYIWKSCPNIIPPQARNIILKQLGFDTNK